MVGNIFFCTNVYPFVFFQIFTSGKMEKSAKNIKELAAHVGLSIATVSRVLNGKARMYRISDHTSKKVLEAARLLNYSPNKIARGLKLTRTETLGLVIPDIANPFFASIAKVIELESRKRGYSLILCDSMDDTDTEKELLQLMWSRKVDGIIIAPVGYAHHHIDAITQHGVPIIVMDRYFPGHHLPYVTTDNYTGAYQAVDYLLGCGHTRIACIQGIQGISVNTSRVQGYRDALLDHGIIPADQLILGHDFGEENGYIQARALMNITQPPTAILALSNLISLGVIRALKELKLMIPSDISLVSFDEQPYSAYLSTPLTTIEQPRDEIALLSLRLLLEQIENPGKKPEAGIMLKPRLIIRESVRRMIN